MVAAPYQQQLCTTVIPSTSATPKTPGIALSVGGTTATTPPTIPGIALAPPVFMAQNHVPVEPIVRPAAPATIYRKKAPENLVAANPIPLTTTTQDTAATSNTVTAANTSSNNGEITRTIMRRVGRSSRYQRITYTVHPPEDKALPGLADVLRNISKAERHRQPEPVSSSESSGTSSSGSALPLIDVDNMSSDRPHMTRGTMTTPIKRERLF